jgi:hypothetical protein
MKFEVPAVYEGSGAITGKVGGEVSCVEEVVPE